MTVAYWMCFVALLLTTCIVEGLPNGAPRLACEDGTDLVPSHFFPPSSDPLPYVVDISHFVGQTYVPDQQYSITLRSGRPGLMFRGFMIQGRIVADNSPVGSWQVQGSVAQTTCSGKTAATHVSNAPKELVTLSWKAPPAGTGTIRLRYSFVETFSKYWSNLVTSDIQEADKAVTSPTSVTVSPTASSSVSNSTSSQLTSIIPSTALPVLQATSSPVPTNASATKTTIVLTPIPTTAATTPDLVSCQNITGYPVCSEDYCSSARSRFARCSSRIESCSNACMVTTCRACIFTDGAVDLPKECVREECSDLKCVVRWSRCAHTKILTHQLKKEERKPENYKCFVPNCY